MPNAVRNSIDSVASSAGVRRSGQARARSAKFSVPACPYNSPIAVSRNADASRFRPDVGERRMELRARAVQRHQHERGDQHHLEPDVEVEDVAGQEGAGHAHQQHVDERVIAERFTARIDAGKRMRR